MCQTRTKLCRIWHVCGVQTSRVSVIDLTFSRCVFLTLKFRHCDTAKVGTEDALLKGYELSVNVVKQE